MKKVVACLELYVLSADQGEFGLIVSLPGREGTLTHRASCRGGIPTEGQLEVLIARVGQICTDAWLLASIGIQGQLPC